MCTVCFIFNSRFPDKYSIPIRAYGLANPDSFKIILLVAASCLAAAAVCVSGIIGFVGLLVPHLVRLIVGPDYRILIPMSALAGGLLLILADIVARTTMAPAEMPIGILTTLLGGPFFLYLLHRRRSGLV